MHFFFAWCVLFQIGNLRREQIDLAAANKKTADSTQTASIASLYYLPVILHLLLLLIQPCSIVLRRRRRPFSCCRHQSSLKQYGEGEGASSGLLVYSPGAPCYHTKRILLFIARASVAGRHISSYPEWVSRVFVVFSVARKKGAFHAPDLGMLYVQYKGKEIAHGL